MAARYSEVAWGKSLLRLAAMFLLFLIVVCGVVIYVLYYR